MWDWGQMHSFWTFKGIFQGRLAYVFNEPNQIWQQQVSWWDNRERSRYLMDASVNTNPTWNSVQCETFWCVTLRPRSWFWWSHGIQRYIRLFTQKRAIKTAWVFRWSCDGYRYRHGFGPKCNRAKPIHYTGRAFRCWWHCIYYNFNCSLLSLRFELQQFGQLNDQETFQISKPWWLWRLR